MYFAPQESLYIDFHERHDTLADDYNEPLSRHFAFNAYWKSIKFIATIADHEVIRYFLMPPAPCPPPTAPAISLG